MRRTAKAKRFLFFKQTKNKQKVARSLNKTLISAKFRIGFIIFFLLFVRLFTFNWTMGIFQKVLRIVSSYVTGGIHDFDLFDFNFDLIICILRTNVFSTLQEINFFKLIGKSCTVLNLTNSYTSSPRTPPVYHPNSHHLSLLSFAENKYFYYSFIIEGFFHYVLGRFPFRSLL